MQNHSGSGKPAPQLLETETAENQGDESRIVPFPAGLEVFNVTGFNDDALRSLEESFPGVSIFLLDDGIRLEGPPARLSQPEKVIIRLFGKAARGSVLTPEDVREEISSDASAKPADAADEGIVNYRGKAIRPKSEHQQHYVSLIDENAVVFGIGPAGTGKTYLAVAKAVQALLQNRVSRIILTRPAVEAGEKLGFLPGTLGEKIDPFLRPLHDALHDMISPDRIARLFESGVIEVAPLAYMRGRTLNNAFVILDEAQNTTAEQMRMFLTRLGLGSTMVVTGDLTQVDLPSGRLSGLKSAAEALKDVEGIGFSHFGSEDVVRHWLVGDIIDAYARWDRRHEH